MYYRSKSYGVKAFEVVEETEMTAPWWFMEKVAQRRIVLDIESDDEGPHLFGVIVKSPHADLYANLGDYVIIDRSGHIDVMKPQTFRRLYSKQDF